MAKVKIVCDASYDDKLRLTGLAGGLYVSEAHETTVSYMYNGAIGELHNIQEGELFAILSGLRELELRNSVSQLEITNIEIFTDSKSSVLTLLNKDQHTINDHRTRQLFTQIQRICARNNWSPRVDHVNSHVELHNASGIERLNLIADHRANAMRKAVIESLVSPSKPKTDLVTVLLPKSVHNIHEEKAFKLLAKELHRRNKKVRLFIEGNNSAQPKHPFIDAMKKLQKTQNINFLDVDIIKPKDKVFALGLNSILYRYHNMEKGAVGVEPLRFSQTERNAFSAAMLLHGDLTFKPRGPVQLPMVSDAVYDLMDPIPRYNEFRPDSIQGWCDSFCEHTHTPHYAGLKASFHSLNLPVAKLFPRRIVQSNPLLLENTTLPVQNELKTVLKDIIEHYSDSLEPYQVSQKLVDEIVKSGYPKDNSFRDALMRFVSITPRNNVDTFVNRIVKQADKLTPPSQKKTPNEKLEVPSSILEEAHNKRAFKF